MCGIPTMWRRRQPQLLVSATHNYDPARAADSPLMDKSLNTEREGGSKMVGGGGQVKFYPYKRGGWKSFSHVERVGTASFEVVLTQDP